MQVNEEQNIGGTVVDRKTEQGFTPGPWKIETPRDREEADGGCSEWDESYPRGVAVRADWNPPVNGSLGYQICRLSGVNNHTLPDARLIAAAPALYEVALRAADYLCTDRPSACSQTRIDTPHCVSCLARAALALVNKPDTNSANSIHPAHGQASKTEVQK